MLIISSLGFLKKILINQTKTKIFPGHDSFLHSFGLPLFLEGKNISGLYSELLAYNSR